MRYQDLFTENLQTYLSTEALKGLSLCRYFTVDSAKGYFNTALGVVGVGEGSSQRVNL